MSGIPWHPRECGCLASLASQVSERITPCIILRFAGLSSRFMLNSAIGARPHETKRGASILRIRRVQFRIWSLMALVALVGILCSIPVSALAILLSYAASLSTMVLIPVGLASGERRIDAAYWALVLHPIAILVWISVWSLLGFPRGVHCTGNDQVETVFIDKPYELTFLSCFYLPILGIFAWAWAAYRSHRRSTTIPLLILPIVWIATVFVQIWDPFHLHRRF